jgi:hypothetical protein
VFDPLLFDTCFFVLEIVSSRFIPSFSVVLPGLLIVVGVRLRLSKAAETTSSLLSVKSEQCLVTKAALRHFVCNAPQNFRKEQINGQE